MQLPMLEVLIEQSPLSDEAKAIAANIFNEASGVGTLSDEQKATLQELIQKEIDENTGMIDDLDRVEKSIQKVLDTLNEPPVA